jgi:hypothetical protein
MVSQSYNIYFNLLLPKLIIKRIGGGIMNEVSEYSLGKVALEDKNIAFVVVPNDNRTANTRDDADKVVGAYIPKLMSEIDMGNRPWIKKEILSSSMVKNSNIKIQFQPVEHRNYYNVRPLRNSNTEQPSLHKGENFWVKFLDNDIKKGVYEPRFMDETKRTHDRHRIFIKDKASINSPDKEYEVLLDSKEQVIRLFMDNGRGEKDQYTFEINGEKGTVEIKDTKGNMFLLNSVNSQIKLQNASGSEINLQGGRLDLNASDGVFINGVSTNSIGGDI